MGNIRQALVTGATGFVGSHLAAALARRDWAVHVMVRPSSDRAALASVPCTVHHYDGSTASVVSAVKRAAPDVVFHLASLYLPQRDERDVERLIEANVLFGTQLLEAMALSGVRRLVNTGTSWQHFQGAPYSPVCLYAATKQAFEAILQYYVEAHSVRALTLKLSDTYGPGDRRQKLFALLAGAAGAAQPLAMSPGEQHIDLVHIDDVTAAYLAAAAGVTDASPGHAHYAVSSGAPMLLRDVVALYEKTKAVRLNIAWGKRPYRAREPMQPWRGPALPGWQPRITLAEGIASLPDPS